MTKDRNMFGLFGLAALFCVVINVAALAGGVWIVVKVLQWTGVL